jgi:hypothetical protein
MMKSLRRFAVLLLAAAPGCALAAAPVTGFVYSDVKYGGEPTEAKGMSKHGMAEAQSILGIVGQGDASVKAACANGGITTIHHVDYHAWSILGIYAKFTVHVYGE